MTPFRLSDATLASLEGKASLPRYDRAALKTGIVHLGVGAFHRAHQACYTEAALNAGDLAWGSVGVSLRSAETRDALQPQEGLYTVAVRGEANDTFAVNGGMRHLLVAPENPEAVIAAMAHPDVRIVSLTVTEKGYCRDPATGDLDEHSSDVQHDLKHAETPRSALGYLLQAIIRRKDDGLRPFTILSCDNLPENGHTLKRVLMQFASLQANDLARHIEDAVPCPSTMIDRIVPATTDADRALVSGALGLTDAWPVMTEPFTQWVIEDSFTNGRPDWALMGAEFVADAKPYETMKLRLLNGAHSAIAYLGYLAGFETVADAMAEPVLAGFIETLMRAEASPTLTMPPGANPDVYIAALLKRFRNPALNHRTWQIAMDGSQKLPQRWLGTVRDRLAKDRPIDRLALGIAAWARYVGGVDERGRAIDVRDPLHETYARLAGASGTSSPDYVSALMALPAIFGADLPRDPRFTTAVREAYGALAAKGALGAMRALSSGSRS